MAFPWLLPALRRAGRAAAFASPEVLAARNRIPKLAAALERGGSAHGLPRGSLMRLWRSVHAAGPAGIQAAVALIQQQDFSCDVLADWVEALFAALGQKREETTAVWVAFSERAVAALEQDTSSSWSLFSHRKRSSLLDVARITSAYAVAAPHTKSTARVCAAAAAAASCLREHARNGNDMGLDGKAWRRLAWACAVGGSPHTDIFGFPDVRASRAVSHAVWTSFQHHAIQGPSPLVTEPFPLLHMPCWLPQDLREVLLEVADQEGLWEASPLAAPGSHPAARTSRSAVLAESRIPRAASKAVTEVQEQAANLFGLPPSHMEPPQLVSYGPGERYSPHVDWGKAEDATLWLAGQRVASALVYLSDQPLTAGGATHFPKLDIHIEPVMGLAIAWPNVSSTGEPMMETEHEAKPLAFAPDSSGQVPRKVALNLWARDRPRPGPW